MFSLGFRTYSPQGHIEPRKGPYKDQCGYEKGGFMGLRACLGQGVENHPKRVCGSAKGLDAGIRSFRGRCFLPCLKKRTILMQKGIPV